MTVLNYNPSSDNACDLFERSISALMLEMLIDGCPPHIVDKAVDSLRRDFDNTRLYLRDLERGAARVKRFGCFRVDRFRCAMAG
ncbi:hypothetical protein [Paraburkholderia sp. BCC1876]|uniref:hypothetical protein n=1 Tax=Paraburkholderia sp. BCC1876 TaxID=2676303 RepID=UPI001591AB20|nr:hypothetical protein [Paraburkholderia sp. BCC1876]